MGNKLSGIASAYVSSQVNLLEDLKMLIEKVDSINIGSADAMTLGYIVITDLCWLVVSYIMLATMASSG